ncbi:lymphotoxin-beta [Ornithorhynchus anatinus]|uniref:Ltb n=1 Tax=Ornithorhynchus anatinus TaxID=9258 RepID=A7X5T4_ORNAN|nr:lymphotoxin-beta [Ornithorhynchus anatinus]ABU86912.1 Ltb [Ornithorhynchus anatinus]
MGARGGEPGRPLLAVVGAAVLGTLLVCVPLTALVTMALGPRSWGQEAAPEPPGGQRQQQMGEDPSRDPGVLPPGPAEDWGLEETLRNPAAHLIGIQGHGPGHLLHWVTGHEEAFLKSGARLLGTARLALPREGVYYLYCHVGFRGRGSGGHPGAGITVSSRLYRVGGGYGAGEVELMLQGAETVTPPPGDGRGPGGLWHTSVGFGGLARLGGEERIFVNVSHPNMVDYRRGKTYFGAVRVG